MNNSRLIAFYLPQYYPTKENDEWWAKGFTEWTNVGNAKPLFKGHYQPKVPADLGYYDLRVPEVRVNQALLAREAGIEGFCYWHYWFNGKRLLDRVFEEVVESGSPDFPFCLCWANHSWYQKTWNVNTPNKLLMEQTYGGVEDYTAHFNAMLKAFKDSRYMKSDDGRLIFAIYEPLDIPDFNVFKETWNKLAIENGLKGFYFIGFTFFKDRLTKILDLGYDSTIFDPIIQRFVDRNQVTVFMRSALRKLFNYPDRCIDYSDYSNYSLAHLQVDEKHHPCVNPNFDHSPRSSARGIVLRDNTPEKWFCFLKQILRKCAGRKDNLVFVKAWNEWGEGNYLEPDLRFGKQYIEKTKEALDHFSD